MWEGPLPVSSDPYPEGEFPTCTPRKSSSIPHGTGERVDCGVIIEAVPLAVNDGTLLVGIYYKNGLTNNFKISPNDLVAYQSGVALQKYSKSEAIDKFGSGLRARSFLARVASIVDALGTGMSAGRENFQANYRGMDEGGNIRFGTISGTVNDPDTRREAMRGVVDRSNAMQSGISRRKKTVGMLEQNYWGEAFLVPGEERMSLLLVKLNDMKHPIRIRFELGVQDPVLQLTP